MHLGAKSEVSSIILTSFRQGSDGGIPPRTHAHTPTHTHSHTHTHAHTHTHTPQNERTKSPSRLGLKIDVNIFWKEKVYFSANR